MAKKCNCPNCTKTPMREGEVYRCKRSGGIMGLCMTNTTAMPLEQLKKAMAGKFDNEKKK